MDACYVGEPANQSTARRTCAGAQHRTRAMMQREVLILASDAAARELLEQKALGAGGAQRLRRSFVRALCADAQSKVSIVTAQEYAAPLANLPLLQSVSVNTFEHWVGARARPIDAVVHCLDASIAKAARLSRAASAGRWCVTGMTHDVFDADVAQDLTLAAAEGLPPVAIACASDASRGALSGLVQLVANSSRVALPIIPHGVDVAPPRPEQRNLARKRFGWSDATVVVLYLGRLSLHAKADILGLLDACSQPAPIKNMELVVAGAGSDDLASMVARAKLAHDSGLPVRVLVDISEAEKSDLLAAGDIFVSPSNSLQESFGLALVEAMAAGLPVVATDWSAYRELIEPGLSGLLVPTLASRSGLDVAWRLRGLEGGLTVHARASAGVEIDFAAMRASLQRLVGDPHMRQQLGAEAARAARNLSLERMVRGYRRLWSLMPRRPKTSAPGGVERVFRSFPTRWTD